MNNPFISVVMPAFNAEKSIGEAIKSVQAQAFQDWELIIVDDGSIDKTAAVVETFLGDRRVQLIRQKNAGVSEARNTALKVARGEWVGFLDSDDVWFPELMKELVAAIQPQTNLVFSNYTSWDGEREYEPRFAKGKFPTNDLEDRLIRSNLFGICSVLVKRETLNQVGFFDRNFASGEDWDLWLRISEKGMNAVGIDKPLFRYRRWSGNASNNTMRKLECDVRVLEKAIQRVGPGKRQDRYIRVVRIARGNLVLATVGTIPFESEKVRSAVRTAWRHCPSRLKWFAWYVGASLPGCLGGNSFRGWLYQKIRSKW